MPKLEAHVAALDRMLSQNAKVAKRERSTFQRMYEELRPAGYTGGYHAVRCYGRA